MNVVLAESLDRFSRDQEHIAGFYKTMRHLRVRVVTVAEGEINELHIGLKGTMNALYLKDLGEKTHRGLEGRVREGKSAGGRAYGYRSVVQFASDATPIRGDLVIDAAEAEVIRRVFRDYAAGLSPRKIAAQFNAEGIPGPRGGPWGASTIYGNPKRGTGLLNNELYVGRRVWNRQRFEKDPETGKRQARPNDEADLVVQDAPELRLIEQELWAAVKARQQSVAVEDSTFGAWDRRRPRYLFSGLMVCGCCRAGYAKVGANRFGCSSARNKGSSVCSNPLTISQTDLEGRVLHGLQEHLMDPELVRVFCEEYAAELNRLRANAGAARAAKEAELGKVTRDHAKLVDAILAGVPATQVKDRMIALDARRQQIEAELVAAPEAQPVRLHPTMAETYRVRVRELVAGLSDTDHTQALEAREAVRALVDRIVLTPSPDDPKELTVDLEGVLAQLFWLGLDHKGSGGTADRRESNKKAAPFGAADLQLELVAGAGYNEERTARELRLAA